MTVSSLTEQILRQAVKAKNASRILSALSSEQKARGLEAMASALEKASADILFRNEIDVEAAKDADLSAALIDRWVLAPKSVQGMAQAVRDIAQQKGPVGEVLESWTRPNGIRVEK